jgi:hypothetical protein
MSEPGNDCTFECNQLHEIHSSYICTKCGSQGHHVSKTCIKNELEAIEEPQNVAKVCMASTCENGMSYFLVDDIVPPVSFCLRPVENYCMWCHKLARELSFTNLSGWYMCDDHNDVAQKSLLSSLKKYGTFPNIFNHPSHTSVTHFYRKRIDSLQSINSMMSCSRVNYTGRLVIPVDFANEGEEYLYSRNVNIQDFLRANDGLAERMEKTLDELDKLTPKEWWDFQRKANPYFMAHAFLRPDAIKLCSDLYRSELKIYRETPSVNTLV